MKGIKFVFFIIFISLNVNKIITQSQTQTANVYYSKVSNKYTVKYEPINKDSLAYANYTLSYEIEGWDHLYLSSSDQPESIYSDYTKHYGMGYLEGYITYKRLYDHYRNNNTYFHEVYNYYNQMIGILDGYNTRVQEEKAKNISLDLEIITLPHFMAIISVGDIDELGYLNKANRPNYKNMTSEQIKQYVTERMHCSSLIKVAPDFSDVWFGHSTWGGYNRLLKTFKEYRYYPGGRFPVKANTIMVSGYAGAINSNDDFYITSANLYVAETTNNVFNTSLFDNLTPESFMCWMRTMVALRLADNGKDWCKIFQRLFSEIQFRNI